jgi:maleylpyruvate isomerase
VPQCLSGGQALTPTRSIGWMREGEKLIVQAAHAAVPFERPSLLTGWTRKRVLSHLAGNAVALSNLLTWARTGVETPMYADAQAREDGIEQWCGVDAVALLLRVNDTRKQLDQAVTDLPEAAWDTKVQTNSGRIVEASFVPWMRAREVYIHAVDLDCGVTFADIPVDVRTALLDEVVPFLSGKAGCPALDLRAANEQWQLTDGGDVVQAPTTGHLLAWLIGRSTGEDLDFSGELPSLPRWL